MAKLETPIKQATRSCMVEGRPGNCGDKTINDCEEYINAEN